MSVAKHKKQSPCLSCTRVQNPSNCENKQCRPWQQWFFARWAEIHVLAQHKAVAQNLSNDPCDGCVCFGEVCTSPCKTKLVWREKNKGVECNELEK